MAKNDTEVIVQISADMKDLKQGLQETRQMIEQESRKWDSAIDQSSQHMSNSFAKALDVNRLKDWGIQAAKAMIDFGMQCVNAASDLEEVQNVVDVTFGDSASQIDAWAKTAINQFGLTETKAKQFASTLGAMMKSSGLAGNEIVEMSESLAGLAADMASFYNLDFDTAFQKIRSGISGETEPLKQLGINMSQANLQAFALEKGITKALDKMSQGEMVMLRYQYLMQATADAQGDFARTSDGFANSQRLLSANLEAIQTKLGQAFIPILANATTAVNDFLTGLVQERPRTVLDDFADINLKTEEKLKEIEKTAEQAEILISTLGKISAPDTDLTGFISGLSGSIGGLDSALQKAKEGNVTGALSDLADALSKELGGSPEQWQTLLGAVADKLPSAKDATLDDNGQTAAFLTAAAAAADDLGGDYSALWGNLLSAIGENAGAVVTALANAGTPGQTLSAIAEGANKLSNSAPGTWSAVLGSLTSIDGLENIFGKDAGAGVKSLAEALSGNGPDKDKAEAWKTLITTLSENAEALSSLTGDSAQGTKDWLEKIQEAASKLKPDDAKAWQDLFGTFLGGLGGGEKSEEFLQGMAQEFLVMGSESEVARQGLLALYGSTDEVESKQAQWLETCRRLVQTMPGLNTIINTQTGEVKGGVTAIQEYTKEYEKMQKAMIAQDALKEMRTVLAKKQTVLFTYELDTKQAEAALEKFEKEHPELANEYNNGGAWDIANRASSWLFPDEDAKKYVELISNVNKAKESFKQQSDAVDEAANRVAFAEGEINKLTEGMGDLADGAKEAGDATAQVFTTEQINNAKEAITELESATKALKDYTDQVFNSTKKALEGTLGGFNRMVDPFEQARKKVVDLKTQLNDFDGKASEKNKLKVLLTDAQNAIPTIQNLNEALESQLKFLNDYYDNIAKMKAAGYSDDVIAMVSDGSAQSAAYAKALAEAGANDPRVAEINKKVQDIQQKTTELTGTLTENKLKVDEKAQELTDTWAVAVANLDQYIGAKENTTRTLDGIVEALGEGKEKVRSEVQSIIDMLTELSNASYTIPNVNLTNFGTGGGNGLTVNVHSVTTLDGRTLSNSVSQHQADQLNQMNRSGGVLTE